MKFDFYADLFVRLSALRLPFASASLFTKTFVLEKVRLICTQHQCARGHITAPSTCRAACTGNNEFFEHADDSP